jgi:sulfite oxidase
MGTSWQDAVLETPASPYAWTRWSLTLPLSAGEPELWLRAFDDAGTAQPLDPNSGWNPAGYEWHSVQRVRLAVR